MLVVSGPSCTFLVKRPQHLPDGLKKVPEQEESVRNCRCEEVDMALRH